MFRPEPITFASAAGQRRREDKEATPKKEEEEDSTITEYEYPSMTKTQGNFKYDFFKNNIMYIKYVPKCALFQARS